MMAVTETPPVVLTIAGSDSGGAAGVAADLCTFAALGLHGAMAITAVTAQSTVGVHRITPLTPADVVAQVDAVLADLPVAAVKLGMLGNAEIARAVMAALPLDTVLVVDPVLAATSGATLADDDLIAAYREVVLPRATVATPNREELEQLGPLPCATLVTGGGSDVLLATPPRAFRTQRIETVNDHGTGCTHSAALCAFLARGQDLIQAAQNAQTFVTSRLLDSAGWTLGTGPGPVAHRILPS